MAAADEFAITIKGVGGHGATPQGTVDAVLVSAHLVTALQTIVSRNTCLLYTSDAADDMQCVDLGGRRIIK